MPEGHGWIGPRCTRVSALVVGGIILNHPRLHLPEASGIVIVSSKAGFRFHRGRSLLTFLKPSPGGSGSDDTLDNTHLMRMAGRFSHRIRDYAKAHDIPVIEFLIEIILGVIPVWGRRQQTSSSCSTASATISGWSPGTGISTRLRNR